MSEPMAYIGRKPGCGCIRFAAVDVQDMADSNAKEIADLIRRGWTIERVTCQFVRDSWGDWCDVCKPRPRSPSSDPLGAITPKGATGAALEAQLRGSVGEKP